MAAVPINRRHGLQRRFRRTAALDYSMVAASVNRRRRPVGNNWGWRGHLPPFTPAPPPSLLSELAPRRRRPWPRPRLVRLAVLSLGPGPGAAEMILARCWNYYESCGAVKAIDADKRSKLERIIEGMAARSLRCFAFACKQVIRKDNKISKENNTYKLEENELTVFRFVGLKDPCRPRVRSAVKACKLAGVDVKMITGDNIFTAKAIAFECGILEPDDANIDGTVVEGQEFRNFLMEERLEKVGRIRVMANFPSVDSITRNLAFCDGIISDAKIFVANNLN